MGLCSGPLFIWSSKGAKKKKQLCFHFWNRDKEGQSIISLFKCKDDYIHCCFDCNVHLWLQALTRSIDHGFWGCRGSGKDVWDAASCQASRGVAASHCAHWQAAGGGFLHRHHHTPAEKPSRYPWIWIHTTRYIMERKKWNEWGKKCEEYSEICKGKILLDFMMATVQKYWETPNKTSPNRKIKLETHCALVMMLFIIILNLTKARIQQRLVRALPLEQQRFSLGFVSSVPDSSFLLNKQRP